MTHEPVVIERTLQASTESVWKALTNKDEMKQWYFNLAEFIPEIDFYFEFEGGPDDRKYRHLCRITEVITGKKLTYTWRYDGYEGSSMVTWQLFAEGSATRLKLTHKGLETFPASNPDFAKENFVQGWTAIIDTSLKEYVEKASF